MPASPSSGLERVAITGIGVLCAAGAGRDALAQALRDGRDCLGPIEGMDAEQFSVTRVGQVRGVELKQLTETPKTYLDRCTALTLAACYLAVRDAGLDWRSVPEERRSASHGTMFGCLDTLAEVTRRILAHGIRGASPMLFTHAFANTPASLVAIEYSIKGPAPTFCCGRAASAEAIEYGWALVEAGDVDFCLAGGADALSEPALAALDEAGAVSDENPPGEGAAILVLEPESRAGGRAKAILRSVAVAQSLEDAVSLAGAEGLPCYEPAAKWGDAFGAEFALRLAAAVAEGASEPVAVCHRGGAWAACAVVEGAG